jgi:hypothetical protein
MAETAGVDWLLESGEPAIRYRGRTCGISDPVAWMQHTASWRRDEPNRRRVRALTHTRAVREPLVSVDEQE